MFGFRGIAKIGDRADIPQQLHPLRPRYFDRDLWHLRQNLERGDIIGIARPRQPRITGGVFQTADQTLDRHEIQIMVAPI